MCQNQVCKMTICGDSVEVLVCEQFDWSSCCRLPVFEGALQLIAFRLCRMVKLPSWSTFSSEEVKSGEWKLVSRLRVYMVGTLKSQNLVVAPAELPSNLPPSEKALK
jgi:hypothetical protein